jgi:hypothetical protein
MVGEERQSCFGDRREGMLDAANVTSTLGPMVAFVILPVPRS